MHAIRATMAQRNNSISNSRRRLVARLCFWLTSRKSIIVYGMRLNRG